MQHNQLDVKPNHVQLLVIELCLLLEEVILQQVMTGIQLLIRGRTV